MLYRKSPCSILNSLTPCADWSMVCNDPLQDCWPHPSHINTINSDIIQEFLGHLTRWDCYSMVRGRWCNEWHFTGFLGLALVWRLDNFKMTMASKLATFITVRIYSVGYVKDMCTMTIHALWMNRNQSTPNYCPHHTISLQAVSSNMSYSGMSATCQWSISTLFFYNVHDIGQ
jgi:hypothetical protein